MEKVQRTLEIERIVNLVKGFGWELVSTQGNEDELRLTISKKIKPPVPGS